MVAAVVGIQPFGGEGLSGTGPKAGGPLYLYRLLSRRPDDAMLRAFASVDDGASTDRDRTVPSAAMKCMQQWAAQTDRRTLAALCERCASAVRALCERCARLSCSGATRTLPGPTGERNVYSVQPRDAVLCVAEDDADRLVQLAAVLAVCSRAVWPAQAAPLRGELPAPMQQRIVLARDWASPAVAFDAALHHGSGEAVLEVLRRMANARADRWCSEPRTR